eukprot:NODE_2097_length_2293_cov_4.006925.p1 GENE.NODE_2097_length_2293_cov_4.006925~~NODE_2097_length_2293_cov_4.006925.p1  ORF type:complete len:486 (-),score=104.80 NODE_2097_length_2293_cov_4.006925:702-2159(-)
MAWWWRLHTTTLAARHVPGAFVIATQVGGLYTLCAYAIMLAVFLSELRSYLARTYTTYVGLDRSGTASLQINFDVNLFNIECRNLNVVVFSQAGEAPMDMLTQDFWLRSIDQSGRPHGVSKRARDAAAEAQTEHERTVSAVLASDGQQELDADWRGSHDGFKHQSFDNVIRAPDFTLINFGAPWCTHCAKFAPSWQNISRAILGDGAGWQPKLYVDRSGQMRIVRPLQLNCGAFGVLCRKLRLYGYPAVRLYKGDGSFAEFEDGHGYDSVLEWVEKMVRMNAYGWARDEAAFERGCNTHGRVQVPRVPGHIEFQAGFGDQHLLPEQMNVSHQVNHLSFSDPSDGVYHRVAWAGLPPEVVSNLNPIDGDAYVSPGYMEAWVHYITVVTTVGTTSAIHYQFSHHHRLSKIGRDVKPQVRFHYDIEPFSLELRPDGKCWYDFITSLLALLGGAFVTMRLLSLGTLALVPPARRTSGVRLSGQLDEVAY